MKKTGSRQSVPERPHFPLMEKANWRLIAGFVEGFLGCMKQDLCYDSCILRTKRATSAGKLL